ncbi:TetR/AcrR family transcriptional regulator [Streptomyces sp. AC550_RSS872]|uniref:TetR/AcrR family transcriptional regulator n=1 Tax=Streptomyces sp. AC550_RSS872 TaxID=2823689 RepID=UPI001C27B659|nr:TetR/AcrR family transcriptional regulator [Streptomyces sp. AC550_RSS872]
MARPKSDSREKILASAHRLLCRQGYRGTGLAQIVEEADAPRGSVYYLFPGGKEEIAVEAVHLAAVNSVRHIEATRASHPTARAWVSAMADHCSRHLMETGFSEGLPITTVTLDSVPGSDALAAACRDAYRTLVASLAETLEHYGITPAEDARSLAMLLLGALEGSMVLARADQSLTPCRLILQQILPLFPDHPAPEKPGADSQPH